MSTYDFSTLYTTLPHILIEDKLYNLIERTFYREGSPYLACNDRNAFLLRENLKNIMHVPRGCLQFVIVVFPDHAHLLFLSKCI